MENSKKTSIADACKDKSLMFLYIKSFKSALIDKEITATEFLEKINSNFTRRFFTYNPEADSLGSGMTGQEALNEKNNTVFDDAELQFNDKALKILVDFFLEEKCVFMILKTKEFQYYYNHMLTEEERKGFHNVLDKNLNDFLDTVKKDFYEPDNPVNIQFANNLLYNKYISDKSKMKLLTKFESNGRKFSNTRETVDTEMFKNYTNDKGIQLKIITKEIPRDSEEPSDSDWGDFVESEEESEMDLINDNANDNRDENPEQILVDESINNEQIEKDISLYTLADSNTDQLQNTNYNESSNNISACINDIENCFKDSKGVTRVKQH